MKVVRSARELHRFTEGRVGLVPTMGAFHEGHLDLMRQARSQCDTLVVSLFVNPTQFGPGEDFNRYPRNEERDFDLARSAGVDVMFAPSVEEMFPRRTTVVSVREVTERWEGAWRPGHFDGVATIVCKLFHIVRPRVAIFGLKDLQQCAVIRRMVEDLDIPVELKFAPTKREPDGLAMSSRNAYLNPTERKKASLIFQELKRCREDLSTMTLRAHQVAEVMQAGSSRLAAHGFEVDYFALVDTHSMAPLEEVTSTSSIIAAARLSSTRLIDNIQIADNQD